MPDNTRVPKPALTRLAPAVAAPMTPPTVNVLPCTVSVRVPPWSVTAPEPMFSVFVPLKPKSPDQICALLPFSVNAVVASIPPPANVSVPALIPVPKAVAVPIWRRPAVTVTPPGKTLPEPLSKRVPKPALVSVAPAEAVRVPERVAVERGLVTVMVRLALRSTEPLRMTLFAARGPPSETLPRKSTGCGSAIVLFPDSTPPPLRVSVPVLAPRALMFWTIRLPSLRVTPPLKVFTALSTTEPGPFLTRPAGSSVPPRMF